MSKHTPWPWAVEKVHEGPFSSIGQPVAWVGEPDDAYMVGRINDDQDSTDAFANARLIAAAPELLMCCKALVAAIERVAVDHPNGLYLGSEHQDAVMAIARAEGGSA